MGKRIGDVDHEEMGGDLYIGTSTCSQSMTSLGLGVLFQPDLKSPVFGVRPIFLIVFVKMDVK